MTEGSIAELAHLVTLRKFNLVYYTDEFACMLRISLLTSSTNDGCSSVEHVYPDVIHLH